MTLKELPAGEVYIPREEVPLYLPVAKQTLDGWAHKGRGPRFVKLGKKAAYLTSDLRAWIEAQRGLQKE
jgi:predicted DNA-binding transcriptional regulator AlpA